MPDYKQEKGYDGIFRGVQRAADSVSEGIKDLENVLDAGKKRWQQNAKHAKENISKIKENWANLKEQLIGDD